MKRWGSLNVFPGVKTLSFALPVLALLVAGCGGFSGSKTTTVSGTVVDLNDQPIRDARVSSKFGSTRTSTTGAYSLPRQGEGEVEITAQIDKGGRTYRGRTWVLNFKNGTTSSANIIIAPEDELATVRGTVRDRNGNTLKGASVYAFFGAGSSQRAFSNDDGNYVLRDLVAGVDYELYAGGQGLRADRTAITLDIGETRNLNFVVSDPGIPVLDPPQNVLATTWVSPVDATRRPGGDPYEAVKRLIDPARAQRTPGKGTRLRAMTPDGDSYVEADVLWDFVRGDDVTGFGIYRGQAGGGLEGIDFFADPLSSYYVDLDLRRSRVYNYAVTTISSLYPDFSGTESDLSAVVQARTLASLRLSNPTLTPLTFRWQSGSGGQEFVVFLFEEFPSVDVTSIWNNNGNRATGTSARYDGPALARGTYYYVVVGLADNDDSRTISQVGSFQL